MASRNIDLVPKEDLVPTPSARFVVNEDTSKIPEMVRMRKRHYYTALFILVGLLLLLFVTLLIVYLLLPKEIATIADNGFSFNTVGLNNTCDVNNFCDTGLSCIGGVCKRNLAGGCTVDNDCVSGKCVNNFCSVDLGVGKSGSGKKELVGSEVKLINLSNQKIKCLTEINHYPDGMVNTKIDLPDEVTEDNLIKVINLENVLFLVSEVGIFYYSSAQCEAFSCHPGTITPKWVKLHSYIKVGFKTYHFVPDQLFIYRGVLFARKNDVIFESAYSTYNSNFLAWKQAYWAPDGVVDLWVDQYQNYITLHTKDNVTVYQGFSEFGNNSVDLKMDNIFYENRNENVLYRWFNDFGARDFTLDNSIKLIYSDDQLSKIVGPINQISVAGGEVDVGGDNKVYYHAAINFLHLTRSRVIPINTNEIILF